MKVYVAEPPPKPLAPIPVVIDCSVMASIVFGEGSREEAMAQVAGRALHAPWLLDHEIASVALKKLRGGWPADAIDAGLEAFDAQAVSRYRTRLSHQVEMAERHAISSYDAAYLCVAAALRIPLVTFDRKLAAAARRELGSP